MSQILAAQFGRQLRAAIDVFLTARGEAAIPERRRYCFEVLTDDDPDMPFGALGRILDSFPPATFPLDQLPIPMIPANPQHN